MESICNEQMTRDNPVNEENQLGSKYFLYWFLSWYNDSRNI